MKTSIVGILALAIVACVCLNGPANAEVSARNRCIGASLFKPRSNWAAGTSCGHVLSFRSAPARLSGCSARRCWGLGGIRQGSFKLGARVWTPASDRRTEFIRTNSKQNTEATAKLFKVG